MRENVLFVAKSVTFVSARWWPRFRLNPILSFGGDLQMATAGGSFPISRRSLASMQEGAICRVVAAKSDVRWREAILLTVALWLFVGLIFLPRIIDRHAGQGIGSIALDMSTILVSMLLAMPLFALFRATLTWPLGNRALILLAATGLIAVIHAAFDLLFTGWVAHNLESAWADLPRDLDRGYEAAFRYALVFTVNLALFQLSYARRQQLIQERQLIHARSAAQQAQLTALRYQLNPHFLFNALNSISALIVTRRNEDAERMTDKLSSFLRSSLSTDPAQLIPLEEELDHIADYLDIEAVRFGERLEVSVECEPEAGQAMVPGFLVQPLVENAIKHGVAPSREPIEVKIRAGIENGDLCIRIANDVPRILTDLRFGGGTGVGLLNVERRLHAVYGSAATLKSERLDNSYVATIRIPDINPALTKRQPLRK
jgi:signal transduction histidine kinase